MRAGGARASGPPGGQKCWRNTSRGPVQAAASSCRQGSEPPRRAAQEGCFWRRAARTVLNRNLFLPFRSHAVPMGKPLRRVVLWPASGVLVKGAWCRPCAVWLDLTRPYVLWFGTKSSLWDGVRCLLMWHRGAFCANCAGYTLSHHQGWC